MITISYPESDWKENIIYHIDLWTGSNQHSEGDDQISCEDNLPGGSQTIIKDPPSGLKVETTPLYDVSSHACHNTKHTVFTDTSKYCSGGGSGGGGGGGGFEPSCTWAGHRLGLYSAPNCVDGMKVAYVVWTDMNMLH